MKRMHRKKLSLAVAQALSAGIIVGLAAPAAYAQVPPGQQAAPVEKIEKFNVTGSRIGLPAASIDNRVARRGFSRLGRRSVML